MTNKLVYKASYIMTFSNSEQSTETKVGTIRIKTGLRESTLFETGTFWKCVYTDLNIVFTQNIIVIMFFLQIGKLHTF